VTPHTAESVLSGMMLPCLGNIVSLAKVCVYVCAGLVPSTTPRILAQAALEATRHGYCHPLCAALASTLSVMPIPQMPSAVQGAELPALLGTSFKGAVQEIPTGTQPSAQSARLAARGSIATICIFAMEAHLWTLCNAGLAGLSVRMENTSLEHAREVKALTRRSALPARTALGMPICPLFWFAIFIGCTVQAFSY
jgi:hypothetical protein